MLGNDLPALVAVVTVILFFTFFVWLMKTGYRLVGVKASMSKMSIALAISTLASLAVRTSYIRLTGYDLGGILIGVALGLLVSAIVLCLFLDCGLLQTIVAHAFTLVVLVGISVGIYAVALVAFATLGAEEAASNAPV